MGGRGELAAARECEGLLARGGDVAAFGVSGSREVLADAGLKLGGKYWG